MDFLGRQRAQSERMQTAGEFLGKGRIDAPLALDPGEPLECGGNNADAEMRFSALPHARMSGVTGAFIFDVEIRRRECRLKLLAQRLGDGS